MMNIRDCFSKVKVYTNNGIKNEIPKGNKILALNKLAGIWILVLIYLGITLYTGAIVTFELFDFTTINPFPWGRYIRKALSNIVWNAIRRNPSGGYDATFCNLTSVPVWIM
jgi:hypothetical protein